MIKRIIAGFATVAIFLLPSVAAADSCSLGAVLPPCSCSGNCFWSDFIVLAVNIAQFLLSLLFAATMFMVFLSGLGMLTSHGNAEKIEQAKSWFGAAIKGMFIVLLAWLLVGFVITALTGAKGLFPELSGGGRITPLNWYQVNVTDGCYPYSRQEYGGYTCTDTGNGSQWTDIERQTYCFSNGKCASKPDPNFICCDARKQTPFGQHKQ